MALDIHIPSSLETNRHFIGLFNPEIAAVAQQGMEQMGKTLDIVEAREEPAVSTAAVQVAEYFRGHEEIESPLDLVDKAQAALQAGQVAVWASEDDSTT